MKPISPAIKTILILFMSILFLAQTSDLSRAQDTGQSDSTQKADQQQQFVSIDFNNVDINVFIKFMSELSGTNFVVDQRVKGKVTIISPSKISMKEAYKVFESVLEVHGFTAVKSGEVVKIIPSPDARSKSIETMLQEEASAPFALEFRLEDSLGNPHPILDENSDPADAPTTTKNVNISL